MNSIRQEIINDTYNNIPQVKIVECIKCHYPVLKITNTLIESLIDIAKSKEFSPIPIIKDLRQYNKFSLILPEKIDFQLNDGSVVAITEDTFKLLEQLQNYEDIIEDMKENQENFIKVVKTVLENQIQINNLEEK